MLANELRHLLRALHLFAVDGHDAISRLQTSFGRRRVWLNRTNDDWDIAIVRQKIEEADRLALFGMRRRLDRQRNALTAAIDFQRQRLTGREQSVVRDSLPFWILVAVKVDDPIARFQSRGLGGAAGKNLPDNWRRRGLHAVNQRPGKRNRQCRQDVHDRPRQRHHDALITRPQIESLIRRNVRRALAFDRRVRIIATQLHVATQRNRGNPIVSRSLSKSPMTWAKPKREGLDANLQQLGNDKMDKLMQRHGRAQNKNERQHADNSALQQAHKMPSKSNLRVVIGEVKQRYLMRAAYATLARGAAVSWLMILRASCRALRSALSTSSKTLTA